MRRSAARSVSFTGTPYSAQVRTAQAFARSSATKRRGAIVGAHCEPSIGRLNGHKHWRRDRGDSSGGNKTPRLSGAFLKRMMGLEPTTFCMAMRRRLPSCSASFRLMQT
jgi:hypothetical protein